jgi:hypothetical protein
MSGFAVVGGGVEVDTEGGGRADFSPFAALFDLLTDDAAVSLFPLSLVKDATAPVVFMVCATEGK